MKKKILLLVVILTFSCLQAAEQNFDFGSLELVRDDAYQTDFRIKCSEGLFVHVWFNKETNTYGSQPFYFQSNDYPEGQYNECLFNILNNVYKTMSRK